MQIEQVFFFLCEHTEWTALLDSFKYIFLMLDKNEETQTSKISTDFKVDLFDLTCLLVTMWTSWAPLAFTLKQSAVIHNTERRLPVSLHNYLWWDAFTSVMFVVRVKLKMAGNISVHSSQGCEECVLSGWRGTTVNWVSWIFKRV